MVLLLTLASNSFIYKIAKPSLHSQALQQTTISNTYCADIYYIDQQPRFLWHSQLEVQRVF